MKPSYFCLILLLSPLLWSASCQEWVKDFERQIEIESHSVSSSAKLQVSISFPAKELKQKNVERISFDILNSQGDLIGRMSRSIGEESDMHIEEQFYAQVKKGDRLSIRTTLFRKAKELQLTTLTTVVTDP